MRRKKQRNLNYKADLLADLRESAEFAAEYLSAAYSDSRGAFLVALRDVVEARKGMAKVAAQAKVNRESLYRCLSDAGNPTLSTLNSIWNVIGLDIEFKPKAAKPKAPVAPVAPFNMRSEIKVYEDKTLNDQSFILDDVVFIRCRLKNCDLFYSGGDYEWIETSMDSCRFHWRGAAKNSVALFQSLMGANQQPIVPKPPASTGKPN